MSVTGAEIKRIDALEGDALSIEIAKLRGEATTWSGHRVDNDDGSAIFRAMCRAPKPYPDYAGNLNVLFNVVDELGGWTVEIWPELLDKSARNVRMTRVFGGSAIIVRSSGKETGTALARAVCKALLRDSQ